MYYVGIDLHKETAWCCVLDDQGRRVAQGRIAAEQKSFKAFFKSLPLPFKVAVEATYNWYYVVDIAEERGAEAYLADSYGVKAFAKKHRKNDKIDAALIAWLLQRGDLPTVAIPDKKTREQREVLRYRMKIVSDRTRNIARLKAVLDKLGLDGRGNLNTAKRREEISQMEIPAPYKRIVRDYLATIGGLCTEEAFANTAIMELANEDQDTKNIMSVPGFGYFGALLVKTEIFDINRFRSFPKLCAYSGLAPQVHDSGGRRRRGPLNTNRRKYLQWILVENTWHTMVYIPRLQRKYEAIKKRKGPNTAKIAVARDVLKIIYHILKEKRPYYSELLKAKGQIVSHSQPAGAPALTGV